MKPALLLSIMVATVCTASADTIPVTSFRTTEPITLRKPLMVDSLNPRNEKYQVSALLDEKIPAKIRKNASTLTLKADTNDLVTLPRPASGYAVYQIETTLRADRYAMGSLLVDCPAMFEVFVDGVSKYRNDRVGEDGKPVSGKCKLTLQPQQQYTVTVKVITDAAEEADPTVKVEYVADKDYADVPVTITDDGKRRYQVLDMVLGKKVYSTEISPDGKYLLTKYNEMFGKDKSAYSATLTDLSKNKVIDSNIDTRMKWMPRGSKLYFTQKGENGTDVYTVDVPSMQKTLVIEGLPESHFVWSPAEDYVIYYTRNNPEAQTGALRNYSDPDDRIPGNSDRSTLKMYRPETGLSETLVFGNRSVNVLDIRPDGKKLLLAVADYDAKEWPFYFQNVYELDLATLRTDTLLTHDPDVRDMTYSPDGTKVFVTASPEAFGAIGRAEMSHPIVNAEDVQGYILDLKSRDVRALTKDFNPSIAGNVKWNAADNKIYFLAEDGFDNSLFRLDPLTGKITKVPAEITWIQNYSIGNEGGQWLSYYGQSYNTTGREYLVNLKNDKLTLNADPWAPVSDNINWGQLERFTFNTPDGTEIEGFVTLPPDYDPAKKYPMIVYYYGGTSPTKHNVYSPYNAQLFASRGYIVYQLNPSGTTGYGQEFSARHVNAWGDYTINDILQGVDEVCKAYPAVDVEKIGCIGASYGGFTTEYMISQTDKFAAAVSHAGISNVTSYWGGGYWGYSYNALAAAKSYPWTNPDLYTKHGALFNADKIHTPLLMTHGSVDTNVPLGESIQLYNALKILGQDVELVTVEGEDHHILDYDKKIKWQNTIMAWFAKHLQGDDSWWKSMYK